MLKAFYFFVKHNSAPISTSNIDISSTFQAATIEGIATENASEIGTAIGATRSAIAIGNATEIATATRIANDETVMRIVNVTETVIVIATGAAAGHDRPTAEDVQEAGRGNDAASRVTVTRK